MKDIEEDLNGFSEAVLVITNTQLLNWVSPHTFYYRKLISFYKGNIISREPTLWFCLIYNHQNPKVNVSLIFGWREKVLVKVCLNIVLDISEKGTSMMTSELLEGR